MGIVIHEHKPLGILEGSGGVSDMMIKIRDAIKETIPEACIISNPETETLVKELIKLLDESSKD